MKPFLKIIRYAYIDTPPFEKFKKLRVIQFKDLSEEFARNSVILPKDNGL